MSGCLTPRCLWWGISRKADKWVPLLTIEAPVVPAQLRNRAGIVGAAMAVEAGLHP